MKVSVLIPVFNAEPTLPAALGSVVSQTYPEIELCVVDDCSNDGSRDLISDFKSRFEASPGRTMVIVNNMENHGVAAVRNSLLDLCTGEVVCFLDADDLLHQEALEKAVKAMERDGADIVGWDWTLSSDKGSRYMRQPDCNSPEEALRALMGGTLRWNLWLFLYRRDLFDGVRFLPGVNMGEDMTATLRTMLAARRFTQLHESFYVYRQGDSSISKSMTAKNLADVEENVKVVERALKESSFPYLAGTYLDLLKLNLKLPLLVSQDKNDYIRWLECFPEANASVMRNNHLPMRTKILQWMASERMWLGVRLYNKVIYGILYSLYLCGK
ncbi:MAG: glycosyltransferase [Bacteroidales bacterium]|nr:glycosyltransferase [Bacteroidales bacterium]